ncbi:MAG: hypothetical protein ACQEW2_17740 [Bacillota bacterium]
MTFWEKLKADFEEMIGQFEEFWLWFDAATDLAMIALFLLAVGGLTLPIVEKRLNKPEMAETISTILVGVCFIWVVGSFVLTFLLFAK